MNTYNKSEFQDTSVLSGTGADGARERECLQSVVREGSLEQTSGARHQRDGEAGIDLS